MRFFICAFVWALPAAIATSTHAETEVVVRANRLAAYQGDRAFSTLDLKREDLERATLDQGLKREAQAALFRRSSSLTANPTVQGMSLRAIAPSGAGRALVTLDGVPQNDPFGGWVIWAALPQAAVSHAHVLKGAGGGAYGAGALTGVIDLSLQPPQASRLYLSGTAGEDGNLRGEAGFGLGPVAVYYNDQTLHGDVPVRAPQRGGADVETYGRDQAVFANAQFALCDNCGDLSIMAASYESRRDTGLAGATALSTGNQLAISLTRQPTVAHNGWRVQLWHRDSDLANRSVSVPAGRTGTVLANDQVKTPATGDGFNAALRHQSGAREWEVGIDARTASGESREYYRYVAGVATRYRVSGGDTGLAGVYAEGSQGIGRWLLSGAVRADAWRAFSCHRTEIDTATQGLTLSLSPPDQRRTMVSARAGLAYSASAQAMVRLAAYNGFRPPSLNELYRPFRVGNDVTEANADLRPETLTGIEAGLRLGSRDSFIDADIFANTLKDPITNVTIGTGPATFPTAGFIPAGGSLRQRRNVGEIRATGFEMRSRYALGDRLAVTSSLTATHARVAGASPAVNGKRPAEAPEYSASLGLDWTVAKARVHADLAFEGETFDDDLNTLPLKASRNLSLGLDYPLGERLTLSVSVSNALNDAIQITHAGDGTLGYDTGRRIYVGLSYRR